ALELACLTARANTVGAATSRGEQRQLEIAMTLATEPSVLRLDAPPAGMRAAEAESRVAPLLRLNAEPAIMPGEHHMDAVVTLADVLTVMVNGQVIASGTPREIRHDAGVQAAYLGEEQA